MYLSQELKNGNEYLYKLIKDLKNYIISRNDLNTIFEQFIKYDFILNSIVYLNKFKFETKKDLVYILQRVIKAKDANGYLIDKYVIKYDFQSIISRLINGSLDANFNEMNILLFCSEIPSVSKEIANNIFFMLLIDEIRYNNDFYFVENTFNILKNILNNTSMDVDTKFFDKLIDLIDSNQYICKIKTLIFLHDLFKNKNYYYCMMDFINNPKYLESIMNCMIYDSKKIQKESYNIFNIFIRNPIKNEKISHIIRKNKNQLVRYIMTNPALESTDEHELKEKNETIKLIKYSI
jgi:calcium binding protein 39